MKRILRVPYFPQYNRRTCQSAAIKMFAEYLIKEKRARPSKSVDLSVKGIRKKLKKMGNPLSHQNWVNWFNLVFKLRMKKLYTHHEFTAVDFLINHIDRGYPVIASVSHSNSGGHIILVYGYEQEMRNNWVEHPKTIFYIHDPMGRYDPIFKGIEYIDYGPLRKVSINSTKLRLTGLPKHISVKPKKILVPFNRDKGKGLKLPVTSIRRNSGEDKQKDELGRFKQYELISVNCM